MVVRLIKFKKIALVNPVTYVAMVQDGIDSWEDGYDESEVQIEDSKKDDFPHLRAALLQGGYSFDFFQQRENEGDSACWHHGREGKELYSNNGIQECVIIPLRDLTQ
ncbi:MAG: hypothetical protein Q7K26_00570 [bacterium]|nr:hypothetical protein [bacterium]